MKLLPRQMKPKGFFVQSMKVMAEQSAMLAGVPTVSPEIYSVSVAARKLLQH